MNYGIEQIGVYFPSIIKKNSELLEKFGFSDEFLTEKIGVLNRTIISANENTSDLCIKAFNNLREKVDFDINEIDAVVLITQNPDRSIPHTSSVIHHKLNLKKECACFDVSLGCSGFVYGLSIMKSFLEGNGFKKGLLFTADPYSKIVDPDDKNTSLLFGDAATVSLISQDCIYYPLKFSFGTFGEKGEALTMKNNRLFMDGKSIYNFTSVEVPTNIKKNLELNEVTQEKIDFYSLHPGSRYIMKTLKRKLDIPDSKIMGDITETGNTVSSTIPIELAKILYNNFNNILISGFGVGLSWATTVLRKS